MPLDAESLKLIRIHGYFKEEVKKYEQIREYALCREESGVAYREKLEKTFRRFSRTRSTVGTRGVEDARASGGDIDRGRETLAPETRPYPSPLSRSEKIVPRRLSTFSLALSFTLFLTRTNNSYGGYKNIHTQFSTSEMTQCVCVCVELVRCRVYVIEPVKKTKRSFSIMAWPSSRKHCES